jgi:hypothetical protein
MNAIEQVVSVLATSDGLGVKNVACSYAPETGNIHFFCSLQAADRAPRALAFKIAPPHDEQSLVDAITTAYDEATRSLA